MEINKVEKIDPKNLETLFAFTFSLDKKQFGTAIGKFSAFMFSLRKSYRENFPVALTREKNFRPHWKMEKQ